MLEKNVQLEFDFMKDIRKEEKKHDLKIFGYSMGLLFGGIALVTMPVWAKILGEYIPDRFHNKDAIARYVEPIDGISKGACYQGFDTDSDSDVDKILVHKVHYVGKGLFVPPGRELTEKDGKTFYDAKNILFQNK